MLGIEISKESLSEILATALFSSFVATILATIFSSWWLGRRQENLNRRSFIQEVKHNLRILRQFKEATYVSEVSQEEISRYVNRMTISLSEKLLESGFIQREYGSERTELIRDFICFLKDISSQKIFYKNDWYEEIKFEVGMLEAQLDNFNFFLTLSLKERMKDRLYNLFSNAARRFE